MAAKLTPEAMRAARALLSLTTQQIAPKLGVSPTTLNQLEQGNGVRASTEARIVNALETLGVEILNGDAPGARMIPKGDVATGEAS